MGSKKILLSSFDYPPRLGGVAKCSYALGTALNSIPEIEVRICSPAQPRANATDYSYHPTEHPELGLLRIFWEKRRAFKEWQPDHVIDMIWFPDGLATYLLSFFYRKISFGIVVHGVEILDGDRTWKKRLRKRLAFLKRKVFQRAQVVFPVSSFTRGLIEKEIGHGNLQPFQNGVDSQAFYPKNKSDIDEVTFFTISRLEDYKGIDMALKSLAILKKRGLKFHYRIAGSGPDLPRLNKVVAELGLGPEVTFLGKISDEEALKEYQNCRAFILLSRLDYERPNVEGFGLVFLEAALCGKPAIGPNEGGPLDAVVSGETGLLVDPRDEMAISTALERFFNKDFAEKMGEEARKRALTFSWQRSAQLVIKGLQPCAE